MRLLMLSLILISLPISAQVYRWTDENGVTHFGSQPPPGMRESVDVKPASGSAPVPAAVIESDIIRRAKELDLRKVVEPAGQPENISPEMKFREAANQRACELAKSELESAERILTLYQSTDSYDFALEPRQKKVDHWRSRVRIHCTED
ncbi:DUF4124 domain-containing protein [Marinobacter sp. SS5-14b]|uniref:DUF4124 domain-containing protein n=1 Tax=Marinobacter sp. SS5-14b TaxID=3050456 RepID=UPI0026E0DA53|nr:DUF4124 domain-containing protein [Marinobacter sp. SS5-14b]